MTVRKMPMLAKMVLLFVVWSALLIPRAHIEFNWMSCSILAIASILTMDLVDLLWIVWFRRKIVEYIHEHKTHIGRIR